MNEVITREEMAQLAKEFDPSELEFRPGAFNKDGDKALALAHITGRHVMNRLDEVLPGRWVVEYREVETMAVDPSILKALADTLDGKGLSAFLRKEYERQATQVVKCCISVYPKGESGSLTFEDFGVAAQADSGGYKAAASDALKRAAVNLGIGRYLYALPKLWVAWEGDRYYGHWAEDPAELMETGKSKATSKPKPAPKAAVVTDTDTAEEPVAEAEFAEDDPFADVEAKPTPKPKPKPAPKGNRKDDEEPLQNQLDFLVKLEYNEDELTEETRSELSAIVQELCKDQENPPSVPQISLIFKLCDEKEIAVPSDLLKKTKKTASDVVKKLLGSDS